MSEILRILVMDDDPVQLELVERALPPEWFAVRSASTLEDLAIEGKNFAPDIVLLDVTMPNISAGRTVATAREFAAGARVILYSAWESSKLRSLAQQLGADGHVSKNTSVFTIGQRLRELNGEAK